MSRGIVGAILGFIIGLILALFLERLMGGIGVKSLIVILLVGGGVVLGAITAGLVGAVIGGIGGAALGALAVGFFFTFLKLAAAVLGAVLGWRLATTGNERATA